MSYLPGLMTSVESTPANSASSAASIIRQEGSVYFQAFAMDETAFAKSSGIFFDGLKNTPSSKEGYNQYQYLQALVRSSGMSKGVGPIGQTDPDDLKAMKDVFKSAYLDGVDWQTWLERYAQSPYASSTKGPTFSKSVSTALQLIDKTDAESILSKAYYEAYGKMPSSNQIKTFKEKYATEAQRQLAKTTTTSTTSGGAGSTATSSKTTTSGEGFTQAEQQQFIATFLKDNYQITGAEESGRAKTIVDDIKRVYRDNLLPEPPMQEILAFAAEAIGTGDETMYKQKIDTKLQGIRNAAAKFYPGLTDSLSNGSDVASVADPLVKAVNSYLGINIDKNDSRIKAMLNYNDGKVTRVMNAAEQQKYLESQPEFQVSDAGRAKYSNIAQALENGLR